MKCPQNPKNIHEMTVPESKLSVFVDSVSAMSPKNEHSELKNTNNSVKNVTI